MVKLVTLLKASVVGSLFSTAAFVGYRKKEIADIHRRKREEINRLDAEFDALGPDYKRQIASQHKALQEAQELEKLKVTLWEDRLRRFREETEEFMKYAKVIPDQINELEDLNKMYWMVSNVLQDSRAEEMKFEGVCRKIHHALLSGHDILLHPETVVSQSQLVNIIDAVKATDSDALLDQLAKEAKQLEGKPFESQHAMEEHFNEGLELIERTQFSVSGPDQNDLPARLFSKAQQSLRFSSPVSGLTADAPRKFISEHEVLQGLQFAEKFLAAAKAGQVVVSVTKVPIKSTPEGIDAISFLEGWAERARAYVGLRQVTKGLNAHLMAHAVRLGFPVVPSEVAAEA